MRTNIVAGNWKMNLLAHQAAELANEIEFYFSSENKNCEVFLFPSSIYLPSLSANLKTVQVGAQNAHFEHKGAFTGELSVEQLTSIGVKTVLIGHSERRNVFGESDELINQKVMKALKSEMKTFLCIGEQLDDRKRGNHLQIVIKQLEKALGNISESDLGNLCIAYEPVWAIGTGETASPEQAQEMHAAIRNNLKKTYSDGLGEAMPILYGGSVKPANAKEIFSQKDIDGGLIGGASLNANDFIEIIKAFD